MASATTTAAAAFVHLVLLCFLLLQQISVCNYGCGCIYATAADQEILNRKVMIGKEVVFKASGRAHGSSSAYNGIGGAGENVEGWELRKVPAGPDPLHHNGGSQKKPRTTP